jgi:hypothetical protein
MDCRMTNHPHRLGEPLPVQNCNAPPLNTGRVFSSPALDFC